MRPTALSIAVLVGGCSSAAPPSWALPDAYAVTVDPTVDEGTYQALVQGGSAWEAAAPGLSVAVVRGPCPSGVGPGDVCVVAPGAAAERALMAQLDSPDLAELTVTSAATGATTIDAFPIAPQFLQQVMEHELGHAFGLVHTGAGTVMCASTGCEAPSVTAVDVAQLWAVRSWQRGGSLADGGTL